MYPQTLRKQYIIGATIYNANVCCLAHKHSDLHCILSDLQVASPENVGREYTARCQVPSLASRPAAFTHRPPRPPRVSTCCHRTPRKSTRKSNATTPAFLTRSATRAPWSLLCRRVVSVPARSSTARGPAALSPPSPSWRATAVSCRTSGTRERLPSLTLMASALISSPSSFLMIRFLPRTSISRDSLHPSG